MTEILNVHKYLNTDKAVSSEKGDVINKEIAKHISKNTKIIVDFSDLRIITTAFLNFAVGKLYTNYKGEKIKDLVEFKTSSAQKHKLELVIQNTQNKLSQSEYDEVALNG
ncbi:STAS-like domain-containing protein [Fundicoccus sp. Sow4_D5]|uniref:STAS-like domain-containing protein n=1 Tax=Fundicoccus sp. Sow4_D5 TaxID=3438782 RepID=UPI003F90CF15